MGNNFSFHNSTRRICGLHSSSHVSLPSSNAMHSSLPRRAIANCFAIRLQRNTSSESASIACAKMTVSTISVSARLPIAQKTLGFRGQPERYDPTIRSLAFRQRKENAVALRCKDAVRVRAAEESATEKTTSADKSQAEVPSTQLNSSKPKSEPFIY